MSADSAASVASSPPAASGAASASTGSWSSARRWPPSPPSAVARADDRLGLVKALPALNLDLFTKNQATFGETGRRHRRTRFVGSVVLVARRRGDGAADRRAGRDLRERVRGAADRGRRAHGARRPQRRPLDRDRDLRLLLLVLSATSRTRSSPRSRSRSSCCRSSRARRRRCSRSCRSRCARRARRSGCRKWRTVLRVVLPTTLGGIVTGATLGVARAAGETAPIIFTSTLFTNTRRTDPRHPVTRSPS